MRTSASSGLSFSLSMEALRCFRPDSSSARSCADNSMPGGGTGLTGLPGGCAFVTARSDIRGRRRFMVQVFILQRLRRDLRPREPVYMHLVGSEPIGKGSGLHGYFARLFV